MKIAAQCNTNNTNLNFGAKQLAKYSLFKGGICDICKIEKSDWKYFYDLEKYFKSFCKRNGIKDKERIDLLRRAVKSIKVLLNKQGNDKNLQLLMAFNNGNPCGLLIGNTQKANCLYTCRNISDMTEAEGDLFLTWNDKLKGVGKALFNEFIEQIDNLGFKTVFLRSENDIKSPSASNFYENFGFKKMNNGNLKRYIGNEYSMSKHLEKILYSWSNDLILPMIARIPEITKFSKTMARQTLDNSDIKLNYYR